MTWNSGYHEVERHENLKLELRPRHVGVARRPGPHTNVTLRPSWATYECHSTTHGEAEIERLEAKGSQLQA